MKKTDNYLSVFVSFNHVSYNFKPALYKHLCTNGFDKFIDAEEIATQNIHGYGPKSAVFLRTKNGIMNDKPITMNVKFQIDLYLPILFFNGFSCWPLHMSTLIRYAITPITGIHSHQFIFILSFACLIMYSLYKQIRTSHI